MTRLAFLHWLSYLYLQVEQAFEIWILMDRLQILKQSKWNDSKLLGP